KIGEEVVGTEAILEMVHLTTSTFTVTGTNSNGCSSTEEFTITVDEPTVAGVLEGPENVCISSSTGTLNLTGYTGEIIKWESKSEDAVEWTTLEDGNLTSTRDFSNLTKTTNFRVTVK